MPPPQKYNSKGEPIYEIERILDRKKYANGTRKYLFKWKGYRMDQCTWLPAHCIQGTGMRSRHITLIEDILHDRKKPPRWFVAYEAYKKSKEATALEEKREKEARKVAARLSRSTKRPSVPHRVLPRRGAPVAATVGASGGRRRRSTAQPTQPSNTPVRSRQPSMAGGHDRSRRASVGSTSSLVAPPRRDVSADGAVGGDRASRDSSVEFVPPTMARYGVGPRGLVGKGYGHGRGSAAKKLTEDQKEELRKWNALPVTERTWLKWLAIPVALRTPSLRSKLENTDKEKLKKEEDEAKKTMNEKFMEKHRKKQREIFDEDPRIKEEVEEAMNETLEMDGLSSLREGHDLPVDAMETMDESMDSIDKDGGSSSMHGRAEPAAWMDPLCMLEMPGYSHNVFVDAMTPLEAASFFLTNPPHRTAPPASSISSPSAAGPRNPIFPSVSIDITSAQEKRGEESSSYSKRKSVVDPKTTLIPSASIGLTSAQEQNESSSSLKRKSTADPKAPLLQSASIGLSSAQKRDGEGSPSKKKSVVISETPRKSCLKTSYSLQRRCRMLLSNDFGGLYHPTPPSGARNATAASAAAPAPTPLILRPSITPAAGENLMTPEDAKRHLGRGDNPVKRSPLEEAEGQDMEEDELDRDAVNPLADAVTSAAMARTDRVSVVRRSRSPRDESPPAKKRLLTSSMGNQPQPITAATLNDRIQESSFASPPSPQNLPLNAASHGAQRPLEEQQMPPPQHPATPAVTFEVTDGLEQQPHEPQGETHEDPQEEPYEKPKEQPLEKPHEQPLEKPLEEPKEHPHEKSQEQLHEKPQKKLHKQPPAIPSGSEHQPPIGHQVVVQQPLQPTSTVATTPPPQPAADPEEDDDEIIDVVRLDDSERTPDRRSPGESPLHLSSMSSSHPIRITSALAATPQPLSPAENSAASSTSGSASASPHLLQSPSDTSSASSSPLTPRMNSQASLASPSLIQRSSLVHSAMSTPSASRAPPSAPHLPTLPQTRTTQSIPAVSLPPATPASVLARTPHFPFPFESSIASSSGVPPLLAQSAFLSSPWTPHLQPSMFPWAPAPGLPVPHGFFAGPSSFNWPFPSTLLQNNVASTSRSSRPLESRFDPFTAPSTPKTPLQRNSPFRSIESLISLNQSSATGASTSTPVIPSQTTSSLQNPSSNYSGMPSLAPQSSSRQQNFPANPSRVPPSSPPLAPRLSLQELQQTMHALIEGQTWRLEAAKRNQQ